MNKKDLKRQYKQNPRPMGVFQIRNTVNEKVYVASSLNLPGSFNSGEFQLKMGIHPSKTLQSDWKLQGGENFAFEVLEEVFPKEIDGYDYLADLLFLEDLWLEKLQPFGQNGYNEPKKTREERLLMIAENRSKTNLNL